MIKDKPNKIVQWFATSFAERWVLRHFASIKFIGEIEVKPDRPCLMLMNHFSFNDGPILHHMAEMEKKLDKLLEEKELKDNHKQ